MKRITLSPLKREEKGKRAAAALRKEGFIPASLYGKGIETLHLKIPRKSVNDILKNESLIADVKLEGGINYMAFIRKIQWDHTRDNVYHVDMQVISPDQWIDVDVPIVITGEPKGIAEGGVLVLGLRALKLQCKPDQIPDKIIVDVSDLALNDRKRVQDLKLPAGTNSKVPGSALVASCVIPVQLPTAAEAAAATVETPAEPEVIKEKKKEEIPADGKEAQKGKEAPKEKEVKK